MNTAGTRKITTKLIGSIVVIPVTGRGIGIFVGSLLMTIATMAATTAADRMAATTTTDTGMDRVSSLALATDTPATGCSVATAEVTVTRGVEDIVAVTAGVADTEAVDIAVGIAAADTAADIVVVDTTELGARTGFTANSKRGVGDLRLSA